MLNITGKVRLMNIEDKSDKVAKALLYFGTPVHNSEEWDINYFNCVLVGEAFKKIDNILDKDDIFITSGVVTNKQYTKGKEKRSWLEVKIFDFVHGEEDIKKAMEGNKKTEEKPARKTRERKKA